MFPKIVVPPNDPLKNRGFHYQLHPFWGTPNFWKHPCSDGLGQFGSIKRITQSQLTGYTLLSRIGHGAFATVYKA